MTVLFLTRTVTADDLQRMLGSAATELYRYVADLELVVCGPPYWFYYGMNGRSGSQFTLEVALPVQGKIPTALLPFFKRVPAFRCLSARYEGCLEGLSAHYREMSQYILQNDLKMNGIYAETFLHIDMENPNGQQVEAMIGLS